MEIKICYFTPRALTVVLYNIHFANVTASFKENNVCKIQDICEVFGNINDHLHFSQIRHNEIFEGLQNVVYAENILHYLR